jgi:flagellar M-ring protein FliF
MQQLTSLGPALTRLGPAKLAGLGGAAAVVLLGVYLVASKPQPTGLLYAGLDPSDAGRIAARLEALQVPILAKNDGSILVPQDQVPRLRMMLASEGLPGRGGAGYELLDQQNPMNMTSFMQRVQRLRALEGELARTIVTMQGIKSARVHIVLPEREGFSREAPQPTASVVVTMDGPARLSAGQAAAIRLLVAGAVPRLRQDDVSVVDPSGVVLAAESGNSLLTGRLGEIRAGHEHTVQRAVLDLLEPIIGRGKVKAQASVEIEAGRSVSREERFDPLGQVERSKQTQSESDTSEDGRNRDPVTVGQNLPNQALPPSSNRQAQWSQRASETTNFEISSTTREEVREPGSIKRLTIAVVLDTGTGGQPRPAAELERLTSLVRSAVGYDERRGDLVTVENLSFAVENPLGTSNTDGLAGDADATIPLWLALSSFGGLLSLSGLAFFIYRRRSQRLERERLAAAEAAAAAAALAAREDQAEDVVSLGDLGVEIAASSMDGLNHLIDERPQDVITVLRGWLAESNA